MQSGRSAIPSGRMASNIRGGGPVSLGFNLSGPRPAPPRPAGEPAETEERCGSRGRFSQGNVSTIVGKKSDAGARPDLAGTD